MGFIKGNPIGQETRFKKGHSPSLVTREKMRQAKLGVKRSKEAREAVGKGHKGLPHYKSEQYRRKRSEVAKKIWQRTDYIKKHSEARKQLWQNLEYRLLHSGENHSNWRGGKSFEPYPLGWTRTFKEQIRYRDGYKCQLCGCSETESLRRLHVHHIDYDKNNIKSNNLISLCQSCHMKTNFKRDDWRKYFAEQYSSAHQQLV